MSIFQTFIPQYKNRSWHAIRDNLCYAIWVLIWFRFLISSFKWIFQLCLCLYSDILYHPNINIHIFHWICLFGFNVALKYWGHIMTVPACSSGTLTNVLPHSIAMLQTQDMTSHPVTVYRHGANLSLCYPLMWNVTLECTTTQLNVLGKIRPGNPSPTFYTHQLTLNSTMLLLW